MSESFEWIVGIPDKGPLTKIIASTLRVARYATEPRKLPRPVVANWGADEWPVVAS